MTTGASLIGQVASSVLVAYGFARFRFRGRDALFMLVLATMVLPSQVTMIPQFLMFREAGWLDSYKPLIIPNYFGGGPFYIFLMRQFLLTIPLTSTNRPVWMARVRCVSWSAFCCRCVGPRSPRSRSFLSWVIGTASCIP